MLIINIILQKCLEDICLFDNLGWSIGGVIKMDKLMEDIQANLPQQAANQFSVDSVKPCRDFLVTSWSSIPIRKRSK